MKLLVAVLLGLGLTGCAALNAPNGGALVTVQSGPVMANSGAAGARVGEACSHSVLGLVGFGDASIEAARRNAGITEVSSVDQSFLQAFIFYGRTCTIVRGR